jgi:hypothetical protein
MDNSTSSSSISTRCQRKRIPEASEENDRDPMGLFQLDLLPDDLTFCYASDPEIGSAPRYQKPKQTANPVPVLPCFQPKRLRLRKIFRAKQQSK